MSQCTYYPNEVVQHAVCVFAAFYVDCQPPDFCFVPCGHMASEKTVKYWADVPIPCGTSGFQVSAHLNNFIWLSRGSGQWVCIYDVRIFVQYVIYEAPSHFSSFSAVRLPVLCGPPHRNSRIREADLRMRLSDKIKPDFGSGIVF